MATNYLAMSKSLANMLKHRIEVLESSRTLGLSCISMSECCASSPAAKYAYVLLAEKALDGELDRVPMLKDYGWVSGAYEGICPICHQEYQGAYDSTCCRTCAEAKLVTDVLKET